MAYCRFNPYPIQDVDRSDVYVFMSIYGHLECCGCSLKGRVDRQGQWMTGKYKTYTGMINHLYKHNQRGHRVPAYAYTQLREEKERYHNKVSNYFAELVNDGQG